MTELGRITEAVRNVVEPHGAGFALVGGFAVAVRAEPRFTRDVDFVVAVANDAEAESIVQGLQGAGFRLDAVIEQAAVGRLATARLRADDGALADLLFASSGIEAEIVAAAEVLEVLPGLVLPVASIGHLLALKLLSHADGRPNDLADLLALRAVASDSDFTIARIAVELIEARGFARERDLERALTELIDRR